MEEVIYHRLLDVCPPLPREGEVARIARGYPRTPPLAVVEVQGEALRVRVPSPVPARSAPAATRGAVRGLSPRSRLRLLERFARMERAALSRALFVHLTYPGEEGTLPAPPEAKRHLRAWIKRLRRRWPGAGVVWRFEWDSSGERVYHPHFHLVLFGVPFLPWEWVRRTWGEVIGRASPRVRVERVRSWRGAMAYVSKYAAKETGTPWGVILVIAPYLAGAPLGRVWGMEGVIPWAVVRRVYLVAGKWVFDLKRALRRARGIHTRATGGLLVMGNAPQWARMLPINIPE